MLVTQMGGMRLPLPERLSSGRIGHDQLALGTEHGQLLAVRAVVQAARLGGQWQRLGPEVAGPPVPQQDLTPLLSWGGGTPRRRSGAGNGGRPPKAHGGGRGNPKGTRT